MQWVFALLIFLGRLASPSEAGASFVLREYDLTCLAITGFTSHLIPTGTGSTRPLWKMDNGKVYREEFFKCCNIPTYFPVEFERMTFSPNGDDTRFGINDTITLHFRRAVHQALHLSVFPHRVSQEQISDWIEATVAVTGSEISKVVTLATAYYGYFLNKRTLQITIVDDSSTSPELLEDAENTLNFRVVGNLSDSVGGIIMDKTHVNDTSVDIQDINTINCGPPGVRADATCRVNTSMYPSVRNSASKDAHVKVRHGSFARMHASAVYISQSLEFNQTSSSCFTPPSKLHLNIAFSHPLNSSFVGIQLDANHLNTLLHTSTPLIAANTTANFVEILLQDLLFLNRDTLDNVGIAPHSFSSQSDGYWTERLHQFNPFQSLGSGIFSAAFVDTDGQNGDDYLMVNRNGMFESYNVSYLLDTSRIDQIKFLPVPNYVQWFNIDDLNALDCDNCSISGGSHHSGKYLIAIGDSKGHILFSKNVHQGTNFVNNIGGMFDKLTSDGLKASPAVAQLYAGQSTINTLVAYSNGILRFFSYDVSSDSIAESVDHPFKKFNGLGITQPTFVDVDNDGDIDVVYPMNITKDDTSHFDCLENVGGLHTPAFVKSPKRYMIRSVSGRSKGYVPQDLALAVMRRRKQTILKLKNPQNEALRTSDLKIKLRKNMVKYQATPGNLLYSKFTTLEVRNSVMLHPFVIATGIVESKEGVISDEMCRNAQTVGELTLLKKFTIHFNKPVGMNRVDTIDNKLQVDSQFVFSRILGSNYQGKWVDSFSYTIDITDTEKQSFDVRGRLKVGFAANTSQTLSCTPSSSDMFEQGLAFPMSTYVETLVARGTDCFLHKGSTLTITFNRIVIENPIGSFENVSKVIAFSPSLHANYTGEWKAKIETEGGVTKSVLMITIDHVFSYSQSFHGLRGIFVMDSLPLNEMINENTTLPDCNHVSGVTPPLSGTFSMSPEILSVVFLPGTNQGIEYGDGVEIDITLTTDKTQFDIGDRLTKEEINQFFVPNVDIGRKYSGVWIRYNVFRISIENSKGHQNPSKGRLFFSVQEALRGAFVGNSTREYVCKIEQSQMPPLPKATATGEYRGLLRIVSAIGKDGCTPLEYGIGDRIDVTLSQSALQTITGRPAMKANDPDCKLEALEDKPMHIKYKCMKLAVYDFLEFSKGDKLVCFGYFGWMQWTTMKTFTVMIDDPRDDCSGMANNDGPQVTEFAPAVAKTNAFPPSVIDDDVNALHTRLILEDTGNADTSHPTVIKLKNIADDSTYLKGRFTSGFRITSPTHEHVLIDLKVLYSLLLEPLYIVGSGFTIYHPKTTAREFVAEEKDFERCCGDIKGCSCEAFANEDQFDIQTAKLMLCMDNLLCPKELIPYVMKARNAEQNIILQENCNDPGGTCLLGREGTTRTSATLFFRQTAFGITKGFDDAEVPIQDKLGGAMTAYLYSEISGEVKKVIATVGFITSLYPTRADSGVPIKITISGTDFDNSWKTGKYACHFVDADGHQEVTNATVFNTTRLRCTTPVWLYTATTVTVQVSRYGVILQTGYCDEKVCKTTDALITRMPLLKLKFYESWTEYLESNASITGGEVMVDGNGFNISSKEYRCKYQFSNSSLYYTLSPPAFPLSSTRMVCIFPSWPFAVTIINAIVLHHDMPVQKRDTDVHQRFELVGSCSSPTNGATVFVVGLGLRTLSKSFEKATVSVTADGVEGGFNTTDEDDIVLQKVSSLVPSMYSSNVLSKEFSIPDGLAKVWVFKFMAKIEFAVIPSMSFVLDSSNSDSLYSFVENGMFWPQECVSCPPSIDSSWGYVCMRKDIDGVKCWGDNHQKQLYPKTDPVMMPSKRAWVPYSQLELDSFSVGLSHTCGIRRGTGEAVCFGLAFPGLQIKLEAPADLRFSSVSAGAYHTCGITTDGRLSCWGEQLYGKSKPFNSTCHRKELGFSLASAAYTAPQELACTSDYNPRVSYMKVVASVSHNCALSGEENSLTCWGSNSDVQLGMDDCEGFALSMYERTCAVTKGPFKDFTLGIGHTCGMFFDGAVKCWGRGMIEYDVPEVSFRTLASGLRHVCGIVDGKTEIKCWGANQFGQATAPGDNGYVEIAAGAEHTCAIKARAFPDTLAGRAVSEVVCWGSITGVPLMPGTPKWRGYDIPDEPGYVTMMVESGSGSGYQSLCFPMKPRDSCGALSKNMEPGYRRCSSVTGCGNTYSPLNPQFDVSSQNSLTKPSADSRFASSNNVIFVRKHSQSLGAVNELKCVDFSQDSNSSITLNTSVYGSISLPGRASIYKIALNWTTKSQIWIQKNSIQSDLQSITSNNLLSIQMSGYVWCFYGLPKGSTLSFPQRSVWDLKLQKNNCTFNGRIQTSKETIDRANEEFGKLYEKRLDYFQSTIFFFIFLATMIMLSPTAWSDRVLYESNKDRMNAKVLTFSSTFKAGN